MPIDTSTLLVTPSVSEFSYLPQLSYDPRTGIFTPEPEAMEFEGWFIRHDSRPSYDLSVQKMSGVENVMVLTNLVFRDLDGFVRKFVLVNLPGAFLFGRALVDGVVPGERIRFEYDGVGTFKLFIYP